MAIFLIACGVLLICWGGGVLATGDFIATLDIAAGLVSTGVIVIALAAIVRVLDQLRRVVPARWDQAPRVDLTELVQTEAALAPVEPTARISPAIEPAPQPEVSEPVVPRPVVATAPAAPPMVTKGRDVPALQVGKVEEEPASIVRPAPAAEPVGAQPERTLIREGVIDGRTYRFYGDGSIDADGPDGVRSYASMAEAREQILRARSAQPSVQAEVAREKRDEPVKHDPERPRLRQAAVSSAASEPADTDETASSEARPVSWDGYLAAGRESASSSEATSSSEASAAHPAARPEVSGGQFASRPAGTPEVRPQPRQPSLEQNWSDSFRQLLKKGASPQSEDDSGAPKV
jgi:hypothetical protein